MSDPIESVPLDNSWCPAGKPYPVSYEAMLLKDPALCQAEDPCGPDGFTLWAIQPCEVSPTTTIVAVDEPPMLPSTGATDGPLVGLAGIALFLGVMCRVIVRGGK